jgi:hypothetical protein
MAAGERSPEYDAGTDCSRLNCVSNKNQKYAHSVVFAVLAVIVVLVSGCLMNQSLCHLMDTPPDSGGFIE